MGQKILWMFVGSVPEDGDLCLVWAADAAEAMAAGRKASGYADDPDYEDEDFEVRRATAWDIITFAPALINQTATAPVDESSMDTPEIRAFLTERVRVLAEA